MTPYEEQEIREEWLHKVNKLNDIGIAMFAPSIGDYWISVINKTLEEERNKYENCPQCTGLREELRKEIVEQIKKNRSLVQDCDRLSENIEDPEHNRITNRLNENMVLGYKTALTDIINTLSPKIDRENK